jgi:hypothetical protein
LFPPLPITAESSEAAFNRLATIGAAAIAHRVCHGDGT